MAVVPELVSTVIFGGFITSYSSPPFNTSMDNQRKKILSSDIGE